MYFDWLTWSIWLIGFAILIIWIYLPLKEFRKLYKTRKSGGKGEEMPKTAAVILAAGRSTRMKSDLNKVLLPVLGRPIIRYQIDALKEVKVESIVVVVGYQADRVKEELGHEVEYVYQREQLGTGHALQQAEEKLKSFGENLDLIVTVGDNPYLKPHNIRRLIDDYRKSGADAAFISVVFESPPPYGRVIRNKQGKVKKIVEELDAIPEQLKIKEVNSSIYCFKASAVFPLLSEIKNDNVKKEYYLTDIIEILASRGFRVEALISSDQNVAKGINTLEELGAAEKELKES
jgi:bifunctional UDP-N-acetylglucosamine pyrophosphorylase/glucosamine-1-phosphate N-acetyltransferase